MSGYKRGSPSKRNKVARIWWAWERECSFIYMIHPLSLNFLIAIPQMLTFFSWKSSRLLTLSRCVSGGGRDRQDPFQCKPCGELFWLSWVGYIGKPLGIFSLSLWTAQKVERDQLASVLKIWMAFGVVVASISPSIRSSDTFSDAHAALMFDAGRAWVVGWM